MKVGEKENPPDKQKKNSIDANQINGMSKKSSDVVGDSDDESLQALIHYLCLDSRVRFSFAFGWFNYA